MITGPHATPLRLIHAVHPQPTEPASAPAVLCAQRAARLTAMNDTVRRLRELGVRIVETHVDGGWPGSDDEPLIRIARDPDVRFGPLLDALGPRTWLQLHRGAVSQAAAQFNGCIIVWEERA